MALSSDFIKKNQHFLKSCILYEVLQKKPIFSAYQNFCNTVGKDAMKYADFDFWYYRFYQGELDFDYDRSADPEPKTLVDIPVVLMKTITQNLDPIERARLRYMNHAIKNVADSFPPVFENIEIAVFDTSMHWSLNDKCYSSYKESNGFGLHRSDSPKVEESEECYTKRSLKYLNPLFQIPNLQVDHLSLQFYDEMPDRDDLFPVPLNSKSVYIQGDEEYKVVHFLSVMTPGYLESISLDIRIEDELESYGMIFNNEQFKQAKSVSFSPSMEFNMEELVHFSHLKRFECLMWTEAPLEDVIRIRDTISTFERFESCELECRNGFGSSLIVDFAEGLGEEIPIGPLAEDEHQTITYCYQIPESDFHLELKMTEEKIEEEYRCVVSIVRTR